MTHELPAPIRLGWSARYNEPGGFLYDTKGRFRKTAKVVIVLSIIAIALQIFWMWLLFEDIVPEEWIQDFIYVAIFFTLLTNIVAWAFVNLTWKYARDSQQALDEYSGDLENRMNELGFTLVDLNDIGQAIKHSGLTAEQVNMGLLTIKEIFRELDKASITKDDIKEFIQELPRFKRAAKSEKRLMEDPGDFSIFRS